LGGGRRRDEEERRAAGRMPSPACRVPRVDAKVPCEAKPTIPKHPSPGVGLRITCLMSASVNARDLALTSNALVVPIFINSLQESTRILPPSHTLEYVLLPV
jgi:hypothetical protein